MRDYIIIGAGPAGLQLGYFFEKKARDYLILESSGKCGNFFTKFPRHRTLLSINKIHTGQTDKEVNLRWDWNSLICDNPNLVLKNYTKDYFPKANNLVDYLGDFANYYSLKIKYNVKGIKISKDNNGFFIITDANGEKYYCKRLIIATGVSIPYIPLIVGIEQTERYYDDNLNPEKYRNKKVLIIGKGNSAFETAESLSEFAAYIHVVSPNKPTMAWTSHFPGHLRAVNNNLFDTYHLKSQNAILSDDVKKIERRGNSFFVRIVYRANGAEGTEIYDHVITCTGFKFDNSIFTDECSPELTLNNRFPKQTFEWESTNVKDLYFIGTLMQVRDYKKTASPFIHGFRYNIEILDRILGVKYHNEPLNFFSMSINAEILTRALIERINTASSMWQQFGFICDLIVMDKEKNELKYYADLPVDYIHATDFGQQKNYYTLTLNYTTLPKNLPSSEEGLNVCSKEQREQQFLHPIIRQFCGNELVAEHHVPEDLIGEWWDIDLYIEPLRNFLEKSMGAKQAFESSNSNNNTNIFPENTMFDCKMECETSTAGNIAQRTKTKVTWPSMRIPDMAQVSGTDFGISKGQSPITKCYDMFCSRHGLILASAISLGVGLCYKNLKSN